MTIRLKSSVNQEGKTVFTPRPTFEQVVDAAPATATVTIQFEGRDYTTTFPVMVTEEIRQLPSHSGHLSAEDVGQSGQHESIEEANQAVPFTLREPSYLPSGYRVTQIVVEEPNTVDTWWHAWFVCASERDDPSEHLRISARPADDPRVPGHPYGVDEEVTVNGRPGTYAKTDDEIIGFLPADGLTRLNCKMASLSSSTVSERSTT